MLLSISNRQRQAQLLQIHNPLNRHRSTPRLIKKNVECLNEIEYVCNNRNTRRTSINNMENKNHIMMIRHNSLDNHHIMHSMIRTKDSVKNDIDDHNDRHSRSNKNDGHGRYVSTNNNIESKDAIIHDTNTQVPDFNNHNKEIKNDMHNENNYNYVSVETTTNNAYINVNNFSNIANVNPNIEKNKLYIPWTVPSNHDNDNTDINAEEFELSKSALSSKINQNQLQNQLDWLEQKINTLTSTASSISLNNIGYKTSYLKRDHDIYLKNENLQSNYQEPKNQIPFDTNTEPTSSNLNLPKKFQVYDIDDHDLPERKSDKNSNTLDKNILLNQIPLFKDNINDQNFQLSPNRNVDFFSQHANQFQYGVFVSYANTTSKKASSSSIFPRKEMTFENDFKIQSNNAGNNQNSLSEMDEPEQLAQFKNPFQGESDILSEQFSLGNFKTPIFSHIDDNNQEVPSSSPLTQQEYPQSLRGILSDEEETHNDQDQSSKSIILPRTKNEFDSLVSKILKENSEKTQKIPFIKSENGPKCPNVEIEANYGSFSPNSNLNKIISSNQDSERPNRMISHEKPREPKFESPPGAIQIMGNTSSAEDSLERLPNFNKSRRSSHSKIDENQDLIYSSFGNQGLINAANHGENTNNNGVNTINNGENRANRTLLNNINVINNVDNQDKTIINPNKEILPQVKKNTKSSEMTEKTIMSLCQQTEDYINKANIQGRNNPISHSIKRNYSEKQIHLSNSNSNNNHLCQRNNHLQQLYPSQKDFISKNINSIKLNTKNTKNKGLPPNLLSSATVANFSISKTIKATITNTMKKNCKILLNKKKSSSPTTGISQDCNLIEFKRNSNMESVSPKKIVHKLEQQGSGISKKISEQSGNSYNDQETFKQRPSTKSPIISSINGTKKDPQAQLEIGTLKASICGLFQNSDSKDKSKIQNVHNEKKRNGDNTSPNIKKILSEGTSKSPASNKTRYDVIFLKQLIKNQQPKTPIKKGQEMTEGCDKPSQKTSRDNNSLSTPDRCKNLNHCQKKEYYTNSQGNYTQMPKRLTEQPQKNIERMSINDVPADKFEGSNPFRRTSIASDHNIDFRRRFTDHNIIESTNDRFYKKIITECLDQPNTTNFNNLEGKFSFVDKNYEEDEFSLKYINNRQEDNLHLGLNHDNKNSNRDSIFTKKSMKKLSQPQKQKTYQENKDQTISETFDPIVNNINDQARTREKSSLLSSSQDLLKTKNMDISPFYIGSSIPISSSNNNDELRFAGFGGGSFSVDNFINN